MIKIIESNECEDLEKEVNKFLADPNIIVYSIQYQTTAINTSDNYNVYTCSVMIYYTKRN
jgi:hypothetical protein